MHISWLGQSTIKIDFKTSMGEGSLLFDPYKNAKEDTLRNSSADLVLASHGVDDLITLGKDTLVISGAGEYEYKEVLVYGFQTGTTAESPLIFRTEIEHVTVAHLGMIPKTLDEKLLNELNGVDILLIPVGGDGTLTPERAAEIVTKVEPRVVIPYAFKATGTGANFGPVEPFFKAIGRTPEETQTKIKITKKDLPSDQLVVMVLQKQ